MKLEVLQVGRALAALAVVAHHAAGHTNGHAEPLPEPLRSLFSHAYFGVDFFFVLSGFIIVLVTLGPAGGKTDGAGLWRYASHRARRIYLPYWPIGLGVAALYALVPGLVGAWREWSWLESITLLPLGQGSALSVAWTLKHEVMFYLIWGLGLAVGRPLAVLGAWMGLILVGMVFLPWPELFDSGWRDVLMAPINLEFGLGAAAALWFRSGRRLPSAAYALGAAGPLLLWLALGARADLFFVVGLGLAVAVAWLTTLERAGAVAAPRGLVALGDASYSLYLIHFPLTSLAARLTDTWWQSFLGGIALSLAAAVAYHLLVERPLLAMGSGRGARSAPRPEASGGAAGLGVVHGGGEA